jgi:hypothetical protein
MKLKGKNMVNFVSLTAQEEGAVAVQKASGS